MGNPSKRVRQARKAAAAARAAALRRPKAAPVSIPEQLGGEEKLSVHVHPSLPANTAASVQLGALLELPALEGPSPNTDPHPPQHLSNADDYQGAGHWPSRPQSNHVQDVPAFFQVQEVGVAKRRDLQFLVRPKYSFLTNLA